MILETGWFYSSRFFCPKGNATCWIRKYQWGSATDLYRHGEMERITCRLDPVERRWSICGQMDSWQTECPQGMAGKKTSLVNCVRITILANVPLSVNLHLAGRASDWWQLSVCYPLHLVTPVGCHLCHSKSLFPSSGRSDRGAAMKRDLIHQVDNSCPVFPLKIAVQRT